LIRRPPNGILVLCIVAVCVLMAGALASNLLRGAHYSASDQAFLTKAHPVASPRARLRYVRSLLEDPILPTDADSILDFPIDVPSIPRHITLKPTAISVVVSATEVTPVRASELVNAVSVAIYNAGWRRVRAHAALELARARHSLQSAGTPGGRRLARLRVAHWQPRAAKPVSDIAIGPRASPPRPTRSLDRLLDRLPGPLPPRPSLGTALLAGLVLSLLVCALFYGTWALPLLPREEDATTSSTTSRKA
jgi:hypothetical protein